nr:PREDICTED: serine/arginine-rich splicing factor SR45a-like isoform X2 [Daucus carota subsp. sativus]
MLAIHSRDPLIIVPAEYTAGIISATSITAAANFIPQSLRHQMSYSRRSRYSTSPSSYRRYNRSVSSSRSRSRSLSSTRSRSYDSSEVENPGNNLYVTGLSPRVTKRDIEKHFSTEGKVEDVHLVVDPWSRESRGFGFVTMSSVEEAERCIKYLDRSVLEGRVIMVEKAKRRRGRTPTPGRYLGLREARGRRRSPSYSPDRRSFSSSYSSERDRSRSRSYSPNHYSRGRRSHSSYQSRRRGSHSPYYRRRRGSVSYSPSRSPYSRSPISRRGCYRDYSPDDRYYRRSRHYSPDDRYYGRSRYRSSSRSISPRGYGYSRRRYSRSISPPHSFRRYSPSVSTSMSPPRRGRSYSYSPGYSQDSYPSGSRSLSPSYASSYSRSPSP